MEEAAVWSTKLVINGRVPSPETQWPHRAKEVVSVGAQFQTLNSILDEAVEPKGNIVEIVHL